MRKSIVWSEGMFIAPQHFQHNHLNMQNYINEISQLDLVDGDYGVSQLEINQDMLKIGKLGLRQAAGVLPDRMFFRLDGEVVLDIADGTVDEVILLRYPSRSLVQGSLVMVMTQYAWSNRGQNCAI